MSDHDNVMEHRTLDERVAAAEIVGLKARLARAESIIAEKDAAIDLLIGEIVQCCDVTDQPTNEVIGTARAALALKLDEEPK